VIELNPDLYLTRSDEDARALFGSTPSIPNGCLSGELPAVFRHKADLPLTVGFDFDGVLVGDESEEFYQLGKKHPSWTMEQYHNAELAQAGKMMSHGPLLKFAQKLSALRDNIKTHFASKRDRHPSDLNRIIPKLFLITARNSKAVQRALNILSSVGLYFDELACGIDKAKAMSAIGHPHIFFDDSPANVLQTGLVTPSALVKLGVLNTTVASPPR